MATGATYDDRSAAAIRQLMGRYVGKVRLASQIVRDEIQKMMTDFGPRSGRVYTVPGTSVRYTASAGGEPPAVRTADYLRSWHVREPEVDATARQVRGAAATSLQVNGNVLGVLLEYGTRHMAPRPHVAPALDSARDRIARELRQ